MFQLSAHPAFWPDAKLLTAFQDHDPGSVVSTGMADAQPIRRHQ
jgi:hypothetical protein